MHPEAERAYWNRYAERYGNAMTLLGRPVERAATLAGQSVSGLGRVLEVAAGTGMVTVALARQAKMVVATDYAPSMVAVLQKQIHELGIKNVECEQADIYKLRFETGTFDAVVAANVLHLVPDLDGALRSLRRVLKPGGRLIVPTFCHNETPLSWVTSRVIACTGFPGHRRFTASSFRTSLEQAGLHIEAAVTFPGIIPIAYCHGRFGV